MDDEFEKCYAEAEAREKLQHPESVLDACAIGIRSILTLFGVSPSAILTSTLLSFLLLFGPLRRFTRSFFCNICLFGSYMATAPLINNIFGKIVPGWINSPFLVNRYMYLLMAMYLLILYAGQDNLNALSLQDNENHKRYTSEFIVMNFFFLALMVQEKEFYWPIVPLWLAMLVKLQERKRAFFHASNSGVAQVSRVFADYMKSEHMEPDTKQIDPVTLEGYKYLLEEMTSKSQFVSPSCQMEISLENAVTLDKIWHCQGQLLRSDDHDGHLKDLCLSFSFFWLLLRRFAGYTLYEITIPEAREKTWRLVRNGLILDKPAGDQNQDQAERVFRVIEVELMFLYDYFYTKYYVVFSGRLLPLFLKRCFVVLNIVCISTWVFKDILVGRRRRVFIFYEFYYRIDKYRPISSVLLGVIMVVIVVELLQVFILLTSQWCIVKGICCYYRNKMWETQMGWFFGKVIKILSLFPTIKPWRRKLGQYSLLENYGYDPAMYRFARHWVRALVDVPRPGQKESSSTKLSADVKVALLSSLRINGPNLSNRIAFLEKNKVPVELLSWACELETSAHVILVWHIATSFCEMKLDDHSKKPHDQIYKNYRVAKDLSMYCAYLVAFAPELLPEHEHITKAVFDRVIVEAKKFFDETECCGSKKTGTASERMEQVSDIEENVQKKSNIERGAVLGKRLIAEIPDEEKRWKVLAEFWAELLLYLAPSNQHIGHAQHLVRGGELITLLWALLTHAGIIESKSSTSFATAETHPV